MQNKSKILQIPAQMEHIFSKLLIIIINETCRTELKKSQGKFSLFEYLVY